MKMRAVDADTNEGYISEIEQGAALTDQAQLFSLMSHSQRGRMDEQSCSLDTSKRTSASPSYAAGAAPSAEQRAEDQRAPLTLIPGPKGLKMDKKYFTIPQIVLTPESPAPCRRAISRPASPTEEDEEDFAGAVLPRSATFTPGLQRDRESPQQVKQEPSAEEQERLFSMVSHSQRGRMDEQRCSLERPNRTSPVPAPAPAPAPADSNANRPAQNSDDFFRMVANSQSRRLDDQRVYLRSLPGIHPPSCCSQQNGKVVTSAEPDLGSQANMMPRAQRPGKGEQHGVAAGVMMMLGADAQPRRAHSRPASPTLRLPEDCKPPKRSSSFNVFSKEQNASPSTQGAEIAATDQEKFLSIMRHSQRGRMDGQRCSLDPSERSSPSHTSSGAHAGEDPEDFFKLMDNIYSRRLDDQRATLSPLPSPREAKKDTQIPSTPQRSLTSGSPAPPRRAQSRPTSPTPAEAGVRPTPRSATFCPVSDKDKMQEPANQTTQVTFQVSMSFTPQQMQQIQERQCALPEVFLTLGPPGESVRVPLSPMPNRPASLNLNLSASPCPSPCPSPSHSPASSPHPSGVSPKQAPSKDHRHGPSGQGEKGKGSSKGSGKGSGKGTGKKEGKEVAKKKR